MSKPKPERNKAVYEAYKAGACYKDLMQAFNLGRTTVARIIYWAQFQEKMEAEEHATQA